MGGEVLDSSAFDFIRSGASKPSVNHSEMGSKEFAGFLVPSLIAQEAGEA